MRKHLGRAIGVSAAVAAAFVASGSTASTAHKVMPVRTVVVSALGSKLSKPLGGGALVGNTLQMKGTTVEFACPSGSTLKRGRISTAAGSTGWRTPSSKGKGRRLTGGNKIYFSTVPLATGNVLKNACPPNKKGFHFTEVALALEAECSARTGVTRRDSQFPQMVRIDCDRLEANTVTKPNTFWHECPRGFVMKHKRHTSKVSETFGWGSARLCVRK